MEGVDVVARYSRDGIDWTITDDSAYKALRSMTKHVEDFRPFWPRIEEAIRDDNAQRFATRDGGTWKPLNAKYLKWKAAHGHGTKVLELSGGLKASMTEAGAQGQKVRRGTRELLWRTDYGVEGVALAAFQNRRRKLINENSPFLRKRLGDAASQIALDWKRQWDGGG